MDVDECRWEFCKNIGVFTWMQRQSMTETAKVLFLDVGKTNKRLIIYNNDMKQINSVYSSILTIKYSDLNVEWRL